MSISRLMQAASSAGGAGTGGWDISTAFFNASGYGQFSVLSQEKFPQTMFFKPDGLKMYVVGSQNRVVYEYDLSTAWSISTASYNQSFSVSAQESIPAGLFFKPDGTKMYVTGASGDDVNEYNLSTAWDISTASYSQNFSVATEETAPQGLSFKSDGTKMYIVGTTGDDVNEYNLSTAWDISTASYSQNFSVVAQDSAPTGVYFKSDGTKMYISGDSGNDINEYDLSTAWDISTASYSQNFSVATEETQLRDVFFKSDGTKMYIIGQTANVFEYDLSTAWDISTAAWNAPATNYKNVSAEETSPRDVFFKSDGTKMYITGVIGDDINEYALSSAWDISTASYNQAFSVAAQEANPNSLFFKPDGTKMYVLGTSGRDVNEYNLSTAWDVSTASYVQVFSVLTQDTLPQGLFFKPDGSKMYVVGRTNSRVNEYDLSTAWDVSTASFLQYFTLAQDAANAGIFFKPDGTKMYVIGQFGYEVNEYDLTTEWDVSTASFLQVFAFGSVFTNPFGLFFRPTGRKLYIVTQTGMAVYSFDLS